MDADNVAQLKTLNDELETWRVKGEKARDALDDLGGDADEDELAEVKEAYDHCLAKHSEIAWQIDKLEYPDRHE